MLEDPRKPNKYSHAGDEPFEDWLSGGNRNLPLQHRYPGMTAFQRFIIALLFFFVVAILGILVLTVFQKVVPGL